MWDEIAKLIELAKIPLSQQRILRRSSFAFQEDDGDDELSEVHSADGIIMVSPPESNEDDDDDCAIIQGGASEQNAAAAAISAASKKLLRVSGDNLSSHLDVSKDKGSTSSCCLKRMKLSHVCLTNSQTSSLHLNPNPSVPAAAAAKNKDIAAAAKKDIAAEKFNYVGTSGSSSRAPLGKRKLPVSLVGQVDKAEASVVKQTCMGEENSSKSPPFNKSVDCLLNVLNILANKSQPTKVEPGNLMEIAMRRGLKFPTPFWPPPPKGHEKD